MAFPQGSTDLGADVQLLLPKAEEEDVARSDRRKGDNQQRSP